MPDPPRVAILAPMQSELRPLVKKLALERTGEAAAIVYQGRAGEVEVVATLTGMGMRPAADATERILGAGRVDHVIVTGIAGGVAPHCEVGDLIVPEVVVNGHTGTEHRPTPLGSTPAKGRLVSSDDFTSAADDVAKASRDGVTAMDMETAAAAAVCEQRQIPWSVFRVISDMAGETDAVVLGLANQDGSPNVPAAVRYLALHPWKLPRMTRLARDAQAAADAAADAAIEACRQLS